MPGSFRIDPADADMTDEARPLDRVCRPGAAEAGSSSLRLEALLGGASRLDRVPAVGCPRRRASELAPSDPDPDDRERGDSWTLPPRPLPESEPVSDNDCDLPPAPRTMSPRPPAAATPASAPQMLPRLRRLAPATVPASCTDDALLPRRRRRLVFLRPLRRPLPTLLRSSPESASPASLPASTPVASLSAWLEPSGRSPACD